MKLWYVWRGLKESTQHDYHRARLVWIPPGAAHGMQYRATHLQVFVRRSSECGVLSFSLGGGGRIRQPIPEVDCNDMRLEMFFLFDYSIRVLRSPKTKTDVFPYTTFARVQTDVTVTTLIWQDEISIVSLILWQWTPNNQRQQKKLWRREFDAERYRRWRRSCRHGRTGSRSFTATNTRR